MPTYEYECKKCGHSFEVFQAMSDEPIKNCTECGGEVRRLIFGGAGVIFKGSGFYVTDKAAAKTAGSGKSGSTGKSGGKASAETKTKEAAGGASSPAGDSKPAADKAASADGAASPAAKPSTKTA